MSFAETQREVHAWISQFEVGYFQPMTLVARLAEEVGELNRELNHLCGQKPKKPEEPEASVADEICDVIFVLVALANSLDIDLDEAFARAMENSRARDSDRRTPKRPQKE